MAGLKKAVTSPKEGARETSLSRHTKVGQETTDLKQGHADLGHGPAKNGGATSTFSHMGEKGPSDLGHGPPKNGDATSAYSHVEMGPVDLIHGPAMIGDAMSSFNNMGEMGSTDLAHGPTEFGGIICHHYVIGIIWPADIGHGPTGSTAPSQHCFMRVNWSLCTLDKGPGDHIHFLRILVMPRQ